jgi:hypothetical protein
MALKDSWLNGGMIFCGRKDIAGFHLTTQLY